MQSIKPNNNNPLNDLFTIFNIALKYEH